MFMLSFVNGVREAQGAPPVRRLALMPGGVGRAALERTMGCSIRSEKITFRSADAAAAAARLAGVEVLDDGHSISTPAPISRYGRWVAEAERKVPV